MNRRTKQIFTIVICLVIAALGAYHNIMQYISADQSILKILGF